MNIKQFLFFLVFLTILPFSALADEVEGDAPTFYGEVLLHDYHGESAFPAQEAYFQIENSEGIAVWVTGYRDSEFWSASAGLAKTWDNGWTVALGAGKARFDGESHTVIAPWVSYESDDWELYLSAERYSGGTTYYQGYFQRRFGERHYFGVYGETGLGIGPALTLGVNDHVAFRVVVPVAEREDTKVLVSVIFTF